MHIKILYISFIANNFFIDSEDIEAKPIDKDELINLLLLSNKEQFRSVLNSKKNIMSDILNSKHSKLNLENIAKQTINLIKGDKFIPPKRQFLAVKDLTLENINQKEMIETKNLFEIQNNFKKLKEEADEMLLSNIEKSKKVKYILYYYYFTIITEIKITNPHSIKKDYLMNLLKIRKSALIKSRRIKTFLRN